LESVRLVCEIATKLGFRPRPGPQYEVPALPARESTWSEVLPRMLRSVSACVFQLW